MASIINWDELRQLTMPPEAASMAAGKGGNMFDTDQSANMYNQMVHMEMGYTLNQINCFETSKNDTVLDVGCGPGRISVLMAQRAKSVTSLDQSSKMLAHCKRNAEEAGVKNLKPLLLDWNDAVLGKNVEQHDIVIASRSVGMNDIKRLSSFARKYVVVVAWANALNIPMIIGDLFEGVGEARRFPMMRINRNLGYNVSYNMIYDAGYDPNIRIVTDGFTKDFAFKNEAYDDLWKLQETGIKSPTPIFKKNVDKWLTKNKDDGFTFRRETRSFVIWWDSKKAV
jgi:SAM-dependent methyltransferase